MKKVWVTCPMIEGHIYRCGEEVDETQPGVRGYVAGNPSSYKITGKSKVTAIEDILKVISVREIAVKGKMPKRKKAPEINKAKKEATIDGTRTKITES